MGSLGILGLILRHREKWSACSIGRLHNVIQRVLTLHFRDAQLQGKDLRAVDDVRHFCYLWYLLEEQKTEVETGLMLLACRTQERLGYPGGHKSMCFTLGRQMPRTHKRSHAKVSNAAAAKRCWELSMHLRALLDSSHLQTYNQGRDM